MAAFYVQDATGATYLYTVASPDYEANFRRHAAWWLKYMRKPRQRHDGKTIYGPVHPVRIVVEAD